MNKINTFVIILFFPLNYIIGQNYSQDSIILWEKNIKLTWSDFIGEPDDKYFGDALTSYKIEVMPSNVLVDQNDQILDYEKLNVETHFYKKYSWIITKTDELLEHEQLHFDIAELYARKIRAEFKMLKNKNEARFSSYSAIYNQIWQDCREFQKEYDLDTNHGRNNEKNMEWILKVRLMIEELNAFEL